MFIHFEMMCNANVVGKIDFTNFSNNLPPYFSELVLIVITLCIQSDGSVCKRYTVEAR